MSIVVELCDILYDEMVVVIFVSLFNEDEVLLIYNEFVLLVCNKLICC